jgi:regulation of enolase protein 1 (concanavalin A-like superfamily)
VAFAGCVASREPADDDAMSSTTSDATTAGTGGDTSTGALASTGALCPGLGGTLVAIGFDDEKVAWSWLREEPAGWRTREHRLELQSLPGTMWEGANSTRNVALRPIPAADLVVEVRVQGAIASPAEQAGLLLFADDDNYVKLVKEMVGANLAVVMVTETDGVPVVDGSVPLTGDHALLQIIVDADGVHGSMRTDDGPWTSVADAARPAWWQDDSRLGLFSQGADTERFIAFDAFAVQ